MTNSGTFLHVSVKIVSTAQRQKLTQVSKSKYHAKTKNTTSEEKSHPKAALILKIIFVVYLIVKLIVYHG